MSSEDIWLFVFRTIGFVICVVMFKLMVKFFEMNTNDIIIVLFFYYEAYIKKNEK